MIRVREIDGRIVVDNDPGAEAEWNRAQVEQREMWAVIKELSDESQANRSEYWDNKLQAALSPAPSPTTEPAPPLADDAPPLADDAPPEQQAAPVVDGWTIKRPKRFQGYGYPLFKLLTAAHVKGRPIPTARDVIDAWAEQPPPEVIEAKGDTLKYYDAKGNTKAADLDAIRQAINRMID